MRVRLFTLGCKVNQYESQALRELFARGGFDPVEDGCAEVLVVNSCTVTSMADRKTRQLVRRLRREYPGAVLVLTGCLAQSAPEAAAALAEADIVTGTADRARIVPLVREFLERRERVVSIPKPGSSPFEPLSAGRFDDSFQRAYLKVEDGCDRFCSYCVIPHARGPVRSRPPQDVAAEAERLAAAGYRELVLTGVNLSCYGADLGLRLPDAVRAAARQGLRLRLGSVEPVLITEDDYRALAEIDGLCPQFHLALQSGCDATLRRMDRRYTTAEFADTVSIIRSLFDNPSITTDVIVGFPGETDGEFEQTCRFVDSLRLLRAHVFEYSPRALTPAAAMPDQIPPGVKRERAQRLSGICRRSGQAFAERQLGKTVRVLMEASGGGYADNYLYVTAQGACPPAGEFAEFLLTGVNGAGCIGSWLRK